MFINIFCIICVAIKVHLEFTNIFFFWIVILLATSLNYMFVELLFISVISL